MEWVKLALSFATKLMNKTPDYDQKKRKEFYEKKLSYECEKVKSYPERDDDLILNQKSELQSFLMAFDKEIE